MLARHISLENSIAYVLTITHSKVTIDWTIEHKTPGMDPVQAYRGLPSCKNYTAEGYIVESRFLVCAGYIAPDGCWHTTVAALLEVTGIFLPPSFYRGVI
jgi:hypothetical protein